MCTAGVSRARWRSVSYARPATMPWSVIAAPTWTFTRTNSAPVTAAMPSAARASLRSTFTPIGAPGAADFTARTHTARLAIVSGGTWRGKNGASPKFSTISASQPP
jgi:hypothetical protein